MRPPTMSGHFLLAPIPESSSDYLLPKDIKLAVLGAGRVGKSGECYKGPRRPGVPTRRDAVRLLPAGIPNSPLLSSGQVVPAQRVAPVLPITFRPEGTPLRFVPGPWRRVLFREGPVWTTLTHSFI